MQSLLVKPITSEKFSDISEKVILEFSSLSKITKINFYIFRTEIVSQSSIWQVTFGKNFSIKDSLANNVADYILECLRREVPIRVEYVAATACALFGLSVRFKIYDNNKISFVISVS